MRWSLLSRGWAAAALLGAAAAAGASAPESDARRAGESFAAALGRARAVLRAGAAASAARRVAPGEVEGRAAGLRPGEGPLYGGLPAELPPGASADDALSAGGFLRFPSLTGVQPPIGDDVRVDGADPGEDLLREIFEDDHWASLPPGGRIRRLKRNGAEVWEHPPGMRIVHRFWVRESPRRLFEFRMLAKRADGTWSFGAYTPKADGSLALRTAIEGVSFDFARPAGRAKVDVQRVDPGSCRHCHWMLSDGEQYPTEEGTGPCGFVPEHAAAILPWAAEFERSRGYPPFEDATRGG